MMRVAELLVKGRERAVLCCAVGVSEPIPCSQMVEDVSPEPTWRTPAVQEQDVLSCLSLGGSFWDLLGGHSTGTGG